MRPAPQKTAILSAEKAGRKLPGVKIYVKGTVKGEYDESSLRKMVPMRRGSDGSLDRRGRAFRGAATRGRRRETTARHRPKMGGGYSRWQGRPHCRLLRR